MGVASGMPADPELLPILLKLKLPRSALAGHRDRPRRNLAAAPALRRSRRASAHRARGHLLSRRRHQGDLERAADRGNRRPARGAPGARSRARRKRGRFSGPGIEHAVIPGHAKREPEAISSISEVWIASSLSLLAMTATTDGDTHDQSRSNRRRARSRPDRPGGDRRSPEARGGAVSGSGRADRRRAPRDLHRARARRQPLRQLSGQARAEARREDFDDLQQLGRVRQSAVRHSPRRPGLGARSTPCSARPTWIISSIMPKCALR